MNADRTPRADWPATGAETLPWRQRERGGTKADRMTNSVDAAVPPFIAHLDHQLEPDHARASELALVAVARMDAVARSASPELTRFMIRTESVASSKIERVSASAEDYARAVAGSRANESALSMVAAAAAIGRMVEAAGQRGRIELADLLDAHRILMADDPLDGRHAGTIREEQNWLGGSDHSPRGADYVPPSPDRVEPLLNDLLTFSNRDDLPVLAQAAIAHAQFETIHPFVDGNGRIGRALIGAILRRRDVTRNSIVPIASGLSARQGLYFDALTAYRAGNVGPILALLSRAAEAGGVEGLVSVDRIHALPDAWAERVGARADSAAAKLIPILFATPVISAADVETAIGVSTPQVYAALEQLEAAEVIHEITGRKRNRVWVASDLMDELDDLDRRIRALFNDADSKKVALANIGRVLRASYELGVGSSVPQQLFTDGARFAGVSTEGPMPERARRIAEAAGLPWTAAHFSAGSTVTLAGLNLVLESLLVLEGRRSPTTG
jgi:Fic family protein